MDHPVNRPRLIYIKSPSSHGSSMYHSIVLYRSLPSHLWITRLASMDHLRINNWSPANHMNHLWITRQSPIPWITTESSRHHPWIYRSTPDHLLIAPESSTDHPRIIWITYGLLANHVFMIRGWSIDYALMIRRWFARWPTDDLQVFHEGSGWLGLIGWPNDWGLSMRVWIIPESSIDHL